jgi:amidase
MPDDLPLETDRPTPRTTGTGGPAAGGGGTAGAAASPAATGSAAGDGVDPSPDTAELAWLSAGELAARLTAGTLRTSELVATLERRVAAVDRGGPELRAVLAWAPDTGEVAERLDAERARGVLRSPLHGLPVLVKDNLDTAGLASTAGSLALADRPPERDAPAVARLREAGLVVVGKANLSEWANMRGRCSISGWSAVGGQTRNPHALDRSPGGSSSGSGAAVAAGLVPFAVGTETDGSILCPAAVCGVVGIKPTVGLVSRAGVVPISASQDTVGPLARSVADAAALLTVLAGVDPADPATAAAEGHVDADYARHAEDPSLEGVRLGVVRSGFGYSPKTDAVVEGALERLRGAGAVLVELAAIPGAKAATGDDELTVLLYEFKAGLEAYLRDRGAPAPQSLEELIAFNESHRDAELALFGQELLEAAAATTGLEAEEYLVAKESAQRRARGGLEAALGGSHLDALVLPTMGPAWLIDPVNGNAVSGAGYSAAAVAGTPGISVPVGAVDGLPVGICFLGAAWSEATLVRIAAGAERVAQVDVRPAWRTASTRA